MTLARLVRLAASGAGTETRPASRRPCSELVDTVNRRSTHERTPTVRHARPARPALARLADAWRILRAAVRRIGYELGFVVEL